MPEPSNLPVAGEASGSPRRPRIWPCRPFTAAVVGCVLALALMANIPAVEAPHGVLQDETYGLHFNIETRYEHGWPVRYARRELSLASRNIHEAGASELAKLPNLRKLKITAKAPVSYWAELQERMPECEIKASSYGGTGD